MSTIFGVPLFGTLFMPLIIGVATFLFLGVFVLSKRSINSPTSNDESHKPEISLLAEHSVNFTKEKSKNKKQKGCGSKDGCCSKKDGKSGTCGSKEKAIDAVQVFVDEHSNICQNYASVLSNQLTTASLTVELKHVADSEPIELPKHADGSLCIFLIDTSIINGHQHWLERALGSLTYNDKPLTGMKYSVFMFQSSPLVKSKLDAVDQVLHKSGAVRVCRAESAELLYAVSSSSFDDWAEELFTQVQRWNAPKRKACKCDPSKKKMKEGQKDGLCSSSNSSKSSDSEDDQGAIPAFNPILDLEDIGKFL